MNGELPIEVKKRKKVKRKMTEEQKAAAVERLAKARAARSAAAGAPANVHHSVIALPEDDPLSHKNVREWIKNTREKIKAERVNLRAGVKGAEARIASMEGYVRHLNAYLNNGDYIDMFGGMEGDQPVHSVCLHPSYNKHGDIKRSVGTWYRDIADVWTSEMDAEWRKTRGY